MNFYTEKMKIHFPARSSCSNTDKIKFKGLLFIKQ